MNATKVILGAAVAGAILGWASMRVMLNGSEVQKKKQQTNK